MDDEPGRDVRDLEVAFFWMTVAGAVLIFVVPGGPVSDVPGFTMVVIGIPGRVICAIVYFLRR